MAFEYTNKNNVSLALAVFLMYDDYDYDERPNAISATGLIRPLRQLILSKQNSTLSKTVDVADLVFTRMGSAIHKGCEEAWKDPKNVKNALKALGASEDAANSIRINPPFVKHGENPVYVEQRAEKEILDFIISGKYDLVIDGTLNDYKSTSVWAYIYDSNSDNYIKQGSIYKWLSPDKITEDYININYIFTDWSSAKARADKKSYPQLKTITKKYNLWSIEETENWIMNRLETYKLHLNTPQEGLPECTSEELWATETKYKHYKDSNSTRATNGGTFTSMDDALQFQAQKGGGTIKTVPGEVKACRYCPVVSICTQAETMLADGRLTL
jgi:hypothetical protein